MRYLGLRSILLLLVARSLAGCALPDYPSPDPAIHPLVIVLPELPPAWAGLRGIVFRLSWRGGAAGRLMSAQAGFGSRIEVRLPRGAFQSVLAAPMYGGRPLRPAGALYPSALGGDPFAPPWPRGEAETLELEWEGGYAAEVARLLEDAGRAPEAFDLARLDREVRRRLDDPWSAMAPLEAARRLAGASFRADSLRPRPSWPVVLPGPGPWAPESPLAALPAASGELWTAELPEGLHRFAGGDFDLAVSVEEDGAAAWVRIPRASPAE